MLDILFSLNGLIGGVVDFEMYQAVISISSRMAVDHLPFVLVDATNEVTRDPNVKCPARAARKDVNVELSHVSSFANRDGRDKPGDDASTWLS